MTQAEGGEQGYPLMPLLFSIGTQSGQFVLVVRAREGEALVRLGVGIVAQERGHPTSPGKDACLEQKRHSPRQRRQFGRRGVAGSKSWVPHWGMCCSEHTQERLEEEQRLWDAIPSVPDLQCAWQILVANPRANHTIRTLPPRLSLEHAHGHDKGMWDTAKGLLQQLPGSDEELREAEMELREAEMVARLPMRMGGLGLRSAE